MQEPNTRELLSRFDTRPEFETQFRACLAAAHRRIDLFDPDFAVFPLGTGDVDAALRVFLGRGGVLRLALHTPAHIERHYPRFLRLLSDYGHRAECRATPGSLCQLTDSFCIVDDVHVVRRFHSGHMRGEAAFALPGAVGLPRHRFDAIWEASHAVLQTSTSGL